MWLTGPTDAGLQGRSPTSAATASRRSARPAPSSSCCAVSSTFSRGLSLRSTGASLRRSTIATRISRWPRSPSASSRWRPASRATWGPWIAPTGRTAKWPEAKTVRASREKIEGLRRQMQTLKEIGQQVEAAPGKRVSLTDPDARSMATTGKGTGIVGYNVQIAGPTPSII